MAYCISWTGLDWTGLDWTSKTWTGKTRTSKRQAGKTRNQDRLLRTSFFFLIDFFRICKSDKTNGEQTLTRTNLRLEILFIYF